MTYAVDIETRAEVLASGPCAYCGADAATVDHVMPTVRGGTDERSNLAPCCAWCNRSKGDRLPGEWRVERLAAGLSWPPPPGGDEAPRVLPFDLAEAVELYERGYSARIVASRYGMPYYTALGRLKRAGVRIRSTHAERDLMRPEQRDALAAALTQHAHP